MASTKITAIAIVPMSNCLKSKWISLISQYVERDPVLKALKIGSFPFPFMRGFLRQICFEENPSLMILDTLHVQGDVKRIEKTISSFIRKTTDSAKSKVPEIEDGWGVFPLRTSEILPIYLCPVKTQWKINNTRYSDPYTSGFLDFVLVLMSPPRIRSEKEEKEWCKRVAAAIAGDVRLRAGVMMHTAFDKQDFKTLSILEIEEVLRKHRSQVQMPASKKMISERAVKEHFLRNDDYFEVSLPAKGSTILDKEGIDLIFVKGPTLALVFVQVESKLRFSKLKKFGKNAEVWFEHFKKVIETDLCEKYYVTKDFDEKARMFAKANKIILLTFRDIVRKCPEWKISFKEQGLLD